MDNVKELIGRGKEITKNEKAESLSQEPFVKYNLDEEGKRVDSFTIRMNKQERSDFEQAKLQIQQTKDSTAMKQLAKIGAKVIQQEKIQYLLDVLIRNKRNNKRNNIVDFE